MPRYRTRRCPADLTEAQLEHARRRLGTVIDLTALCSAGEVVEAPCLAEYEAALS